MTRANRSVLFIFIVLIVLGAFLFGGAGITAYAAGSSLPGDTLFPLKTRIERAQVKLTDDSVVQAGLYLHFADRRLSEMQSLIDKHRYADIVLATSEFTNNIQQASGIFQSLSQTDQLRASALNREILVLLRSYSEFLAQNLASIPVDMQPVIQQANIDPQPPASPSIAPPTSTPIIIILSTSTPAGSPAGSASILVVEGGDVTCQGFLGALTVENLEVPQGASCTLNGTRVQGNIFVRNGASLIAQSIVVDGNIQAEGARLVEVLAGSSVGGSIQLKQGGSARVESVMVTGDIQFESNNGALSASGNQVGGNIQVFQNAGGITIASNFVKGDLQCKENNPPPAGRNNTVQGNKEDQCAGL